MNNCEEVILCRSRCKKCGGCTVEADKKETNLKKKSNVAVDNKQKTHQVKHSLSFADDLNKQKCGKSSNTTVTSSKRSLCNPSTHTQSSSALSSNRCSSRTTAKTSSLGWIREKQIPKHAPPPPNCRRMDSVNLYQYYAREWERLKTKLPGETNRDDVRWQIRHKTVGSAE